MPTSIERRKRQAPSRAGQRTTGRPPRGDWDTSATGRYHRREETFSENDLKVFERVEQLIWPLVVEFFQEDEEYGTQGIYRSELQVCAPFLISLHLSSRLCARTLRVRALPSVRAPSTHSRVVSCLCLLANQQVLNAVPGGTSQAWHSDNQSRGLSLIVPLVDFTAENGSTQLLLGSHNKTWPLLAQQGAQVVQAPVGAVVAYDSRTYHRGLGNETDEGRPAIIFCYDRKWSPPPGCGPYQSLVNSNLAALLNIASAGWISITRASSWK